MTTRASPAAEASAPVKKAAAGPEPRAEGRRRARRRLRRARPRREASSQRRSSAACWSAPTTGDAGKGRDAALAPARAGAAGGADAAADRRPCRRAASIAPTPTCPRPSAGRDRRPPTTRREAQTWAAETGRGAGEAGFDLNLAPVADVATLDSPIADRAFGDDPELVAAMTAAAVRGCAAAGIACAVSHFPGLGGASPTPTDGPGDGQPRRGLARGARPARLPGRLRGGRAGDRSLSLAFYAAYDPVTPAALSPGDRDRPAARRARLQGRRDHRRPHRRRDQAAGVGAPEAAVQALAAGADLVLVDDPAAGEAGARGDPGGGQVGGLRRPPRPGGRPGAGAEAEARAASTVTRDH